MTFFKFLDALLSATFEPPRTPLRPIATPTPAARPAKPRLRGLLPSIPGTIVYYSLDGTAAFRFKFEAHSGGIRIYILEQPGYAGRDESSLPTHRLTEAGRSFICFHPLPTTADEAKKVARAWAELTLRYIRTGERF